jgi:hypothetical protein
VFNTSFESIAHRSQVKYVSSLIKHGSLSSSTAGGLFNQELGLFRRSIVRPWFPISVPHITCKRVSAKRSVKDDLAFLLEHAIFRHLPNENSFADCSEVLHIWLHWQDHYRLPVKIGYNRLARSGFSYRWNVDIYILYLTLPNFTLPYTIFVTRLTDQTTEPIYTHDASNDADWSKKVLLGSRR